MKNTPLPPHSRRPAVLWAAVGLLAAWCAVLLVRRAVAALGFPYPLDYREGIVAQWIARLCGGGGLYPPAGADGAVFAHNPYPPLYYRAAALLQRAIGGTNPFAAARWLSAVSLAASAAAIAWIVRRRAGAAAALAAAAIFLCSPVAGRYAAQAAVDLPALACALAGVALLEAGGRRRTAAGTVLCAAAFLVKPLYIAAPIAAIAAAPRLGRRTAAVLLPAVIGAAALYAAFELSRSGRPLVEHLVVLNALPFSAGRGASLLAEVFGRHPFLLFAALLLAASLRKERSPAALYALVSFVAVIFSAKIGAEENYLLEMLAVGAIGMGVLLSSAEHEGRTAVLALAAAQLALYLPLRPAPVFNRTYGQEIVVAASAAGPGTAEREAGALLAAELSARAGPILSEDMGWVLVSDRVSDLGDPYQFARLVEAGRLKDDRLVAAVAQRRYSTVLLRSATMNGATTFLSARVREEILKNYAVRRIIGDWFVLEPSL